ncbi:hypothetical protein FIBSPDRAFT_959733 [Athelia psychrophila]|uniref:Uncharacterized protein n=1 Tax=Athelia psychrophila TaxID=1759441 RepID=A0A166D7L8_9AGAM|nr:hypothetical protein FIBSPDRAFT_959733 [Fibularhizoctonia sp. CBS 109695]
MKLMDIDSDTLGIPNTLRRVRDAIRGRVRANREDLSGSVLLKQMDTAREKWGRARKKGSKKPKVKMEDLEIDEEDDGDEEFKPKLHDEGGGEGNKKEHRKAPPRASPQQRNRKSR